MKAMIFAAGLGTRLRPFTDNHPKALLPLAGKTLLQFQIEQLRAAHITDIVINVHHFAQQIMDYVVANDGFGCHITFSDETNQLLNTGGGLWHAYQSGLLTDEPILALNVDILSNISLPTLLAAYDMRDKGLLVVSDRPTQRYLCFDENNLLCGWTNISTGEVKSCQQETLADSYRRLAFSGMQLINMPHLVPYMETLAKVNPAFSMIDLYLSMPARSFRAYVPNDYRMMDVGKIDQLPQAETFAQSL